MFLFQIIHVLVFGSTLLSGVSCDNVDSLKEAINPCIFTLCIENSTCISIPDPDTCSMGQCENRAICVKMPQFQYNVPATYCGDSEEKCSPNEKCELVQVECFTTPCFPIPMCVPKHLQLAEDLTPSTRAGPGPTNSIKFSKFLISGNNVFHHQRRKGRPVAAKHSSVAINTR